MTANDGQTPVPHPVSERDTGQQVLWAIILLAALVALFYSTSAPPLESNGAERLIVTSNDKPIEQSDEPDPPPPSRSEPAFGAAEVHVEIQSPSDPQSGWLRIAGVATADRESAANGHYRRNNEFDIDTANVDRIDVRLGDLDVNRTRRLIFHIDGQDMLVFVDEIGTIRFVRSPAGLWGTP